MIFHPNIYAKNGAVLPNAAEIKTPEMDASRKAVVISVDCLAGYGVASHTAHSYFNENAEMVYELHEQDCPVVVMYTDPASRLVARHMMMTFELNGMMQDPHWSVEGGTYAEVGKEIGTLPDNVLFVSSEETAIGAMKKEGLHLYAPPAMSPEALEDAIAHETSHFYLTNKAIKAFTAK